MFSGEIRPEPAPRSSLIEDAKIDVETPRKKKSAKKHKNKDKNINVPLMTPSELPSEPILPSERPLSPDSALASSESSGSSLRKQGKIGGAGGSNNYHGLVRIVPYQQFKPVLRKSANIQEKIAIFSQKQPSLCTSSTTGKTFPILRQHGNNHLNKVLYLAVTFFHSLVF